MNERDEKHVKRILTAIVLLAALAASAYAGWTINEKTGTLTREGEARVTAAQKELDEQKAAYAAIDPSTDEGMALRIEAENAAVAEARGQTETLREENDSLRSENEELTGKIAALEADEENAYYLKVYESLHKGMEMVEGYLNGN